jgi:hypothetical protein
VGGQDKITAENFAKRPKQSSLRRSEKVHKAKARFLFPRFLYGLSHSPKAKLGFVF